MSFCVLVVVLLIPFLVAWSEEPSRSSNRGASSPRDPSCGPVARGQRVFSTGHSFHSGFPPILDAMAKSGGYRDSAVVGVSFIGGSKVVQHLGGEEVRAALAAGAVNVLTTMPN